jgi:hypothetical protein
VDGTVTSTGGQFHLTLTVRRGERVVGTRIFESDSCRTLANVASVTIAIVAREDETSTHAASSAPPPPADAGASSRPAPARTPADDAATNTPSAPVDNQASPPANPVAPRPSVPSGVGASPPARPLPVAASTTAPDAAVSKPETPQAEAPGAEARENGKRSAWSFRVEAPFAMIDAGVLPSVSYGAGVGATARIARVELGIAGILWLPQRAGAPGAPEFGGDFVRRTGRLSGCYGWPLGRFDLGSCIDLVLESVSGRGTGPEVLADGHGAALFYIGGAARVRWSPLRWIALSARPGFAVATWRPTFTLGGVGAVHQVAPVTLGGSLGFEWIL